MDHLIHEVLSQIDVSSNPYFVALRDETFEREDFVETQIQFYFAVDFFSRPMAAVAAKIPTAQRRVEILRNVWEEHGEGEGDFMHGSTFLELLHRLDGVSREQVEARVLWPEVRVFNTTLVGASVLDDYRVSVGMMGMIERMFVDISSWIGVAMIDRGWLERDRVVHYNVHEELDVKHAQDFFDVLHPAWEGTDEDRYLIEQGIRLGATVFDGLYRGLYHGRGRRWVQQT